MRATTVQLAKARQITEQLLDSLALDNYLFEIEPGEREWALRLDCPLGEQEWTSLTIPVDGRRLLESEADPRLRSEIRESWQQRLAACRRARGG